MAQHDLEKALAQVSHHRRGFFRTLFVGAGAAAVAVPLMTTQSLAQKEGEDPKDGKCDDCCKGEKNAPAAKREEPQKKKAQKEEPKQDDKKSTAEAK